MSRPDSVRRNRSFAVERAAPSQQFPLTRIGSTIPLLFLLTLMPTQIRAQAISLAQLLRKAPVDKALAWLEQQEEWITEEQIRISNIPAPTFEETARAKYMARLFRRIGLKAVRRDAVGNVLGEWPGRWAKVVLVSAHLDTVFPRSVAVKISREGSVLKGPGIADNGAGLAALVALARAFHDNRLETQATIVFCANVGEEGEGNLRGMRHLLEDATFRRRVAYVITIDGANIDHITSRALASRRFEVIVRGPGGHSWADFGLANPIQALARAISRFSATKLSATPRTSFNIGEIGGGTSVNSIPYEARMKVDVRSESQEEIERLENALRVAVDAGLAEEIAANPGGRRNSSKLEAEIKVIGTRPLGEVADSSRIVETVRAVDKHLGIQARVERSSTDANIPLSLGLEAVALGGGGRGGGSHSLREWYDAAERVLGLRRLLLVVLALAQGEESTSSN